MSKQRLLSEDIVVQKPLNRPRAVVLEAVPDIVHALRHMDVETGPAIVGLHHLFKRLIRYGKQRMAAEHCLDHVTVFLLAPCEEVGVLLDALKTLFLPIALRNLIAEAGAHAELLCDILDRKQRTWNFTKRCMVIEDRRHTVPDALEDRHIGACPCQIKIQFPVDRPPHAVEDLIKVRRIVALD